MKLEEETMQMLIPYFERHDNNCAKIAREVNMRHAVVLAYFSAWLSHLTRHSSAARADARLEGLPKRCPTCGRLKHEVTDMAVCRDVFHYL